ncbi:hypothetical protein R50073_45690 [Maricurvus nonylphenolicus]
MPPPSPLEKDGIELNIIKSPAPQYPRRALSSSYAGWVNVSIDIHEDGSTSNIKAVDASDMKVFGKSAVKSAEQWIFEKPIVPDNTAFPITRTYKLTYKVVK